VVTRQAATPSNLLAKAFAEYYSSIMETLNMMPVEVTFKPSGKSWLASCPSLEIHTQGESFERAQENLKEALSLFIESCLRRGTLDEVLRLAGYSKGQIRTLEKEARKRRPATSIPPECRA